MCCVMERLPCDNVSAKYYFVNGYGDHEHTIVRVDIQIRSGSLLSGLFLLRLAIFFKETSSPKIVTTDASTRSRNSRTRV